MTREQIIEFIEECWDTAFYIEQRNFQQLNSLEKIQLVRLIADLRIAGDEPYKRFVQELQGR
jgi:hypothetical protein